MGSSAVPPAELIKRRRTSDRPPWMEPPSTIGLIAKVAVLVVIVVAVMYPFIGVIGTSFASEAEIATSRGMVLWPSEPNLDAYRAIFASGAVTRALMVSVGLTTVSTLSSLVATVLLAYGLSRPSVPGARPVLMIALFSMLISPGIIPNFLLVRELGLLNSYGALILPTLISAFNMIVMRSFFMNLPQDLTDSARIDGAGETRILVQIILPLSKAVIAVISLFYAVATWNAWFGALLYISDTAKWPLPMILRLYILQGQPIGGSEAVIGESLPSIQAMQMAVLVVALVPILLLYPFLQRYFTKGVLTGAIKG